MELARLVRQCLWRRNRNFLNLYQGPSLSLKFFYSSNLMASSGSSRHNVGMELARACLPAGRESVTTSSRFSDCVTSPRSLPPRDSGLIFRFVSAHSLRFLTRSNWSWREESNLRPAVYKTAALPAELRQHNYCISSSVHRTSFFRCTKYYVRCTAFLNASGIFSRISEAINELSVTSFTAISPAKP